MAISGHCSEQSLVSYNSRPFSSQLHNCSQVLSRAFPPSANNHSQPSETFSAIHAVPDQTSGNETALQRMHYSKRANCFQRFILLTYEGLLSFSVLNFMKTTTKFSSNILEETNVGLDTNLVSFVMIAY